MLPKTKFNSWHCYLISKATWINVPDCTNVEWLQTFHLYKGFKRRQTRVGFFIKGSVRVIQPPKFAYKGYKMKFNRRGDICRAFLVRQTFPLGRADGSSVIFSANEGVLIKKKQNLKSNYIFGPSTIQLKRKKFKSLFSKIV